MSMLDDLNDLQDKYDNLLRKYKKLKALSKPSVVSVDSIINTVIEVAEKVSNQRDMVVVVDLAKLSPSIHNLMTKGQKWISKKNL